MLSFLVWRLSEATVANLGKCISAASFLLFSLWLSWILFRMKEQISPLSYTVLFDYLWDFFFAGSYRTNVEIIRHSFCTYFINLPPSFLSYLYFKTHRPNAGAVTVSSTSAPVHTSQSSCNRSNQYMADVTEIRSWTFPFTLFLFHWLVMPCSLVDRFLRNLSTRLHDITVHNTKWRHM